MSKISKNSNLYKSYLLLQVEFEESEEEAKSFGTVFVVNLIHPARNALQVPWSWRDSWWTLLGNDERFTLVVYTTSRFPATATAAEKGRGMFKESTASTFGSAIRNPSCVLVVAVVKNWYPWKPSHWTNRFQSWRIGSCSCSHI